MIRNDFRHGKTQSHHDEKFRVECANYCQNGVTVD